MRPHQERVVADKSELDENHSRLGAFMRTSTFASLPTDEQLRLSRQFIIMDEYSGILAERIEAFPAEQ
jgi:hypothetical protein